MAEPFLACVFTHLSLNSWPLSCSLYFETNFKKEKKNTGKIPLLMKDSKSLQPAWVFLPFCIEYGIWLSVCHRVWGARSVVSLSSGGCWGGERLFPKSGEAAGSLKTYSLDCKSFSRSILHLLPVSLGSFICFLSTGPNQSSGSREEAVTTGNCDTSLPRQTGIVSGVRLGILGTKAGHVEGRKQASNASCV